MHETEVLEAVREINGDIYERTQCVDGSLDMELRTDGLSCAVMFLGQCVWDEDNDERREIDDTGMKEPLVACLKREMQRRIRQLVELLPENEET